jgi:signal transduction histidine kinase
VTETSSETAIILAPTGRDGYVAKAILQEAGFPAEVHLNLASLGAEIARGAGLAIVADEALTTADLRPLTERLAAQPPWSDFPIILLTRQGGGLERNPTAARLAELLGNVTFLERPFHPTTLVSLVRTSVRSRRRQYEARTTLVELAKHQAELSQLAATLERRVDERTRQLSESEAALRQVQKMEVMGQLTGGVAHDFNNLLMAVMGNLDLLRKQHGNDTRSSRLIEGAIQGAQRGAVLTQRMLAFARQQDLQTHSVQLKTLITGIRDLLERTLGPHFELKLILSDALPPANVDSNQVELAILNLVINARDATPNGGVIEITADYPDTIPDNLTRGSYVRVTVKDFGIGMSPETLKRAVEPFFSTKEVGKGTGLGLSMVHGLAVQLGGLFQLSSVEREGTSATLWLPAGTASVTENIVASSETNLESRKGIILAVDDDALILMATVDMLEDLGHTVLEANSGMRALEIIASGQVIDVMMTDHAMPTMTGIELAELARKQRPNLPIILATGYADLPARQKLDLLRLSKPFMQETLKIELDRILSRKRAEI